METNIILPGDCIESLKTLPDAIVNTCVTSPPYYKLRDYGEEDQIGQEETPQQYIDKMVEVFSQVRRVLRDDGTLWLNLGDTYNGNKIGSTNGLYKNGAVDKTKQYATTRSFQKKSWDKMKPKNLMGIPWRVAMALQEDGWYLRQDIIWAKTNSMPEPVKDRCTKSHEYIFLMSKNSDYYFDYKAIRERSVSKTDKKIVSPAGVEKNPNKPSSHSGDSPMDDGFRHKRSVWNVNINAKNYEGTHFAVYPEELIVPCILAGSPEGGVVLDPFFGAGTSGVVALKNNRTYIGCELNPDYIEVAKNRLAPIHAQVENKKISTGIINNYFEF